MVRATQPSTNLAAVDIPAPGTAPVQGIFAFRAGDEVPQEWIDQQGDYLGSMKEQLGTDPVVSRPLTDAPRVVEEARAASPAADAS